MLTDTNRLGVFNPNTGGFGRNVVGSGASILLPPAAIPLPAAGWLLLGGLAAFGAFRRRA